MARPRLHDTKFLAFLRQKFCVACGRPPPCEAAHIRIGFRALGKKPDDRYATPLCPSCHREQHSMNETEFWKRRGLDPFAIAAQLYQEFGGTGGKPRKRRQRTTIRPKGFGRKIRTRTKPWPKGRKITNRKSKAFSTFANSAD